MGRQNVSPSPIHTLLYRWRKDTTIIMPRQKKSPRECKSFLFVVVSNLLGFLLLEELLVLVVELINTTGAVDELHLTRVEGV